MTNLSEKIIKKIETDDISPKSKYYFLIKQYGFWIAGIISVTIGSIAVAVVIFVVQSQSWGLIHRAGGLVTSLLYVLPYFWIAIFILFVLLAYYMIRHMEGGYKVTLSVIAGIYVVATMIIGYGMYAIGVGNRVEQAFINRAPLYHFFALPREHIANRPEDGLLLGEIGELRDDGLLVVDIEGEEWIVDIANIDSNTIPFELNEGVGVHIFGEITSEHAFKAKVIHLPRMLIPPEHRRMIRQMHPPRFQNERK